MTHRVRRFFPAFLTVMAAFVLVNGSVSAQSWVAVGPPGGDVRCLAADPRDWHRIYLGTADGILYRSEDAGLHWTRLSPGFPLRGCSLDEIAVNDDGVVLVGYWEVHGRGGGVARSYDDGRTFKLLKGIQGESVRALAVAPSDPWVIAAGTLSGVFVSHDLGNRWRRISASGDTALRNLESIAFDPTDPQIIYAGTWHLGWKTLTGGALWMPAHEGMIEDSDVMTLSVDRRNPRIVYATACTGIYRSTDGAMHWTKIKGIPDSSRRTRAFVHEGNSGRMLVAGTTQGVWISQDAGASWRQATPTNLVVNAVIVQPDGTILLGTEGAGVLRSPDLGRTWAASNAGFSGRFVSEIAFDAEQDRTLVSVYGDPYDGGVFVTTGDSGEWTRLGAGLEGRQVLSLGLLGRTMLAGTDDGIFVRSSESRSWKRLPTRIEELEIHPRVTDLVTLQSGTLLAATPDGMLSSLDAGWTWEIRKFGENAEVFGIAISDDAETVVAGTGSGFFRSQDGGATWKQAGSGLRGVTLHSLAFVPSSSRVLFATTSGGLFRSTNQGAAWSRVTGGIPQSDITGLAIHPDGRTIYVSDFTWGGIFRSVDAGRTWKRMPTDGLASDHVWTLGLDPAAPERVLAASPAGGLHLLVPDATAERSAALR